MGDEGWLTWYFQLLFWQCLEWPFGEGNGTPLQYSCLENPMDRGAWWAAVRAVTKSRTRLSDFTFTLHFHALEKEMATHSSVLALRIPGMGEPDGLPSVGSHRVGHDWSDLAAAEWPLGARWNIIIKFLINSRVSNSPLTILLCSFYDSFWHSDFYNL